MIDSFFNPMQYFQNMQNMFDFTKSFNFSNMMPQFDLSKLWQLNKKNINSASHLNSSFNSSLTAIADKQTTMAKENAEHLAETMTKMSQSIMSPQKLMEIQGEFCKKTTAKNMEHAKQLGEMYTKANMSFMEACSEHMKKNMHECTSPNTEYESRMDSPSTKTG